MFMNIRLHLLEHTVVVHIDVLKIRDLKYRVIRVDVRSISPSAFFAGSIDGRRVMNDSHFDIKSSRSFCISATPLPSDTVRIITPKCFGLILSTILRRRLRSVLLFIFFEIEITSENGTNTTYRPAIDISELKRGPFVEIGSLAICTGISCVFG